MGISIDGIFDKVDGIIEKAINGVKNFSERLMQTVSNLTRFIPEIFEDVSTILKYFGVAEDILEDDEEIYEFVQKEEEAANRGIYREDFADFEDYRETLNNENFELRELNDEEKEVYNLVGTAIVKNEIDEKYDTNIPENLYARMSQMDTSNIKIGDVAEIVNKYDLSNEKLEKYENKELDEFTKSEIEDSIHEIIKLSDDKIDKIDSLEKYNDIVDEQGSLFS